MHIFQGNSNLPSTETSPLDARTARAGQDALLPVLWRQRYIVAGCALGAVALAAVYLLFATPIYTSTAQMSVTLATSRVPNETQAITDSTVGSYLYTEKQIIESPAVLSLAAQMPNVKLLVDDEPDPIQFLQNGLDVEVGKRDTVIKVSFSSPDAAAAAKIANGIVKAYMQYQTKPKPADTAELSRLAGERASLDQEITAKNAQMLELEQKYGVLTTARDHDSLSEKELTALSQELHSAHLDTLKAESEYNEAAAAVKNLNSVRAEPGSTASAVLGLGPDQEGLIRTQMLQLQAQLQDLRQHYLHDHPAVQTVERRLNELRVIYAHAVERQYLIARERERDLQAAFNLQQKQAIELSSKTAQYMRLQAEIENARKVEDQIDNRRREVEVARDLGMLNIDPFELAQPELKPSHPSKRTTLPVALVLGLMLGGSLGYLRDWFDDRFRTVGEMRGSTGLQMLGMIPRMPPGLSPAVAGQRALLEPMSEIAEACRLIRTAIYFGAPKERFRTMLITSPAAGEGKSTLVSNLAITMAQAGKRVLIVDADLRSPSQHAIFALRNAGGLSSVLDGRMTSDQVIQHTTVDGLDVMTSGPRPHNPSEMLNSPIFAEVLEILADRYDQIIVDSSPVVGMADSRIVAASCDVSVLVLRGHLSTRRLSELARDGLMSVGANLLGIVINDLTSGDDSSYGAYGYGRRRLGSAAMALEDFQSAR